MYLHGALTGMVKQNEPQKVSLEWPKILPISCYTTLKIFSPLDVVSEKLLNGIVN